MRIKLNADVLFTISKRVLDELDVRPSAVVWSVERDHICRKDFQERAQLVRWRTFLRGLRGDQPRWPWCGHRANLWNELSCRHMGS